MTSQQIETIRQCARQSLAGEITFPEVIGRLIEVGVERYHADYCRHECTYYLPCGDSLVVESLHPSDEISANFVATEVQSAVGQSQRGEHSYKDFVRKTMHAGCVGYFVLITGQRVVYFGRKGESHTEYFPGSAP